ncbi:MAG TPA: hypothetical protein VEL75_15675 [Candidatus Methylomirabilis sp.]|nr:hypothetical protein [Candidatus Methylomirabilis sp.]
MDHITASCLDALFRKCGAEHNFDPLMLVAQSYPESQLNQNRRSKTGAIGRDAEHAIDGRALKVGRPAD